LCCRHGRSSPTYTEVQLLAVVNNARDAIVSAGILEQSMEARNRVGYGRRTGPPPGYIGCRNRSLGIDGLLQSVKILSQEKNPK
jgi:hypothetical protein